jgi:hypothetical protein
VCRSWYNHQLVLLQNLVTFVLAATSLGLVTALGGVVFSYFEAQNVRVPPGGSGRPAC